MMNIDEAQEYISKFTTTNLNRIFVKVDIKGKIWPKEHSPSNVHLCDEIKIIGEI